MRIDKQRLIDNMIDLAISAAFALIFTGLLWLVLTRAAPWLT